MNNVLHLIYLLQNFAFYYVMAHFPSCVCLCRHWSIRGCVGCDETFKDRWVWYSLALPCLGLWRSRWTVTRSSVFTACKSSCSFPILFSHTLKHPLSHMQSWLYFYIQRIFRGPGDHNGAVNASTSSPFIVKGRVRRDAFACPVEWPAASTQSLTTKNRLNAYWGDRVQSFSG